MLLREALQNTIDKLDPDNDVELIASLMNKMGSLVDYGGGFSIEDITDKEMSDINKYLYSIRTELLNDDPYYIKVDNLLMSMGNCETCKLHVVKRYDTKYGVINTKTSDENNPVCTSCNKKENLIHDLHLKIEERWREIYYDLRSDELVMCKYLINKIQTKIKSIKNEASKHKVNVSPTN